MNRLWRTSILVFTGVSALAGAAGAGVETFRFSGTLQSIQDKGQTLGRVEKGAILEGFYWFDAARLREIQASLADRSSRKEKWERLFEGDDDAFGLTVTIGRTVFRSDSGPAAQILSQGGGKKEVFTLQAFSEKGRKREFVTLTIAGPDRLLRLASDPLLRGGAGENLEDRNISALLTYRCDDGGKKRSSVYAAGEVQSHVPAATPEPATMVLLVVGAGMLFFRRARQNRAVRIAGGERASLARMRLRQAA